MMKVAAVELFVKVSRSKSCDPATAVQKALRRDAGPRRKLALDAIRRAAQMNAEVIICPGWTFVGRPLTLNDLRKAAGRATVLFEVLDQPHGSVSAGRSKTTTAGPKTVVARLADVADRKTTTDGFGEDMLDRGDKVGDVSKAENAAHVVIEY
jgi:hypothetical protein